MLAQKCPKSTDIKEMSEIHLNIGATCIELNMDDKAIRSLHESLRIKQTSTDRVNHEEIAQIYRYLAIVSKKQNKLSESLEYHQKALSTLKKEPTPNFDLAANSLHQIGIIHIKQNRHDEALQVLNEAIVMKKKNKSGNEFLIGDILSDIASAFYYKKNYDESLAKHREALATFYLIWRYKENLGCPIVFLLISIKMI